MNKQYDAEVGQAKAEYADFKERGADAIGATWEEVRETLLPPEERAASNLRVAIMVELIHTRQERDISQKKLEAMSGVKQPIIARMEKGYTSPQLDTVLKVLAPLGKTLYIGDLPKVNG
ncbi:MAG: helix-turn-helix domain-containing protein [Synergistaceae bacterium]|jgi:ribosome-binding protein aMBF1 (putative translation factor)|nr:helix-turn-helix domain-containing protein [Synergistaceae bacterium]